MIEKAIDYTDFNKDFPKFDSSQPQTPQGQSQSGEKMEVLKRYSLVFGDIDVTTTNLVPILSSKKETYLNMEKFLDKQHETILKKKNINALNLPEVIKNLIKEQLNINRQHYIQSISDTMYSSEKYSKSSPEFVHFLKFNQSGFNPNQLLFYIYLRQYFKILTNTSFVVCKNTNQDPSTIQLSYLKAQDIIKIGFSIDKTTVAVLLADIKTLFGNKKEVRYYDFLNTCLNSKIGYKDLPLLEHLIALYTIDTQNEFQKNTNRKVLKTKVLQKKDPIEVLEQVEENKRMIQEINNTQRTQKVENIQMSIDSTPDDFILIARKPTRVKEEKTDFKKTKYIKVAKQKLERLYYSLKDETNPFVHNLLSGAHISPSFEGQNLANTTNIILLLIENKLSYLIDAIFQENFKRFSRLLRDELSLNVSIHDFWGKFQDDIKKEEFSENFTDEDVVQLLNQLYNFNVINSHIRFLLEYRFNTEAEIIELQLKEKELGKI